MVPSGSMVPTDVLSFVQEVGGTVKGYASFEDWKRPGYNTLTLETIEVDNVLRNLSAFELVDVRSEEEGLKKHIHGSAGITVGALLAQNMLGTAGYAGVPTALFTLGSAAAAFLVGRVSQRLGRRIGLAAGFLAGGIGALGVVSAAILNDLPLFFISLFIYGAGTATNLQARYAGTDLALPTQRAKAISAALVFTTFGAVIGPNLVNITGRGATSMGAPALSGPFMLAAVAYILAGLALLLFLRPDPLVVAKAIADAARSRESQSTETGAKVDELRIQSSFLYLIRDPKT